MSTEIIKTSARSLAKNATAWSTAWAATEAGLLADQFIRCEIYKYSGGLWLYRGFVVFDTSIIPSDAVISSAYLYSYLSSSSLIKNDWGSYVTLVIQDGSQVYPSLPIVATDFNKELYSVECGSVNVATTFTTPGWVPITLNAAGIARIGKGAGAYTRFAVRFREDIDNSEPSGTGSMYFKASNTEGYRDKLVITYTSADTLVVVTLDPTGTTTESITMNGEITAGMATKRGFDYGDASDNLDSEWYEEGTYGLGTFEKEVTGLTPGQGFCYKAKAYG